MTTRRHPRINVELDVLLRFDDREEATVARTINVSRDGLLVAMPSPRPAGSRVRATLVDTAGNEYRVEGIVVRIQPDGDDPGTARLAPGIGVFLTSTGPGWEKWLAGRGS